MTNATERLRALLDERGVEWEGTPGITFWGNCSALDITTNEKEKVHLHLCCTPEQAIAATLGSEPDEIELIQTYDAGFRNGVMAVFQQLEGIEDYEELQCFIAEYWGEGEGNDEP